MSLDTAEDIVVDAFRAGGYAPDVADRFIRRIKAKIHEGQQLAP